jgi:hypothetical protein
MFKPEYFDGKSNAEARLEKFLGYVTLANPQPRAYCDIFMLRTIYRG